MTYTESAALMNDVDFRNRIKVACLTYANYIFGEPAGTAAHNTRYRWSQQCMQQPDQTAQQIQPNVVMQDAVQAAGANISDADLQTAVETTVNKLL